MLNAGFYKPALLARDVGAVRDLTGGASSSGWARDTCARSSRQPSCRTPAPRERIDHLQHVTEYMREHLPDVPILIAGNGDRVLTVAARQANIIGLTGGDRAAERPTIRWPSASSSSATPQATGSTSSS